MIFAALLAATGGLLRAQDGRRSKDFRVLYQQTKLILLILPVEEGSLSTSRSRGSYRVVPGHRNWQIETAVWNWAGFFTDGLETRWQRFGQFLNDL